MQNSSELFIVTYTSGVKALLKFTPLLLIFGGITWSVSPAGPLYDVLKRSPNDSPEGIMFVFGFLFLVLCAELCLTFLKIILGASALKICHDEIRGWFMWLPRRIKAGELDGVQRKGSTLVIRRRSRNPFQSGLPKMIFQMWANLVPAILTVPLSAVNRSEDEIRAAIKSFGHLSEYHYRDS